MKDNLKNAANAINALVDEIKQLVMDNGGIIDTQKKGCDRIDTYVIEGHGEIYGCHVMGIKVKENHLFILADYGSDYTFGETDIENTEECEWFEVNHKEMLIEQTILSIAESIEQYISNNKQQRIMVLLKRQVKEILADFDSNCITIECCDYKVNGALLTHCYYDEENDKFIFTSGDMETDKHAEEIILNEEQTKEVLESILECY